MDASFVLTDPSFDPALARSALARRIERYINDPRDLPFVFLSARITLFVLPFVVAFFLAPVGHFPWWLALPYTAVLGFFAGPYNLMLHNTSHRMWFKREYRFFSRYTQWFLGLFFGHAPEGYFVHHVAMHHPENNLADDLSSTMPYTRDSVGGFLRYYWVHISSVFYTVPRYLQRKNRLPLRNAFILGAALYYAAQLVLLYWNWRATLVVFTLPYFVMHFLMMAGNWGQHAFVDAAAPENCYRNSITCINGTYNRRCFNDGYHIGHHLKATRHWTEMPGEFMDNRATYAQEGAIVFRTIDFFAVWLFLMLERYDWLAKYYVELDGRGRSQAEIIALLRSRTRAIPA